MWQTGHWKVAVLSDHFRVSRPTIYKVLARGRKQQFVTRRSINNRFKALKFGLKRLGKIEKALEEKRKQEARRYNKLYPGVLVHFDIKCLPLLRGEDGVRHHSIANFPPIQKKISFPCGADKKISAYEH